MAAFTTKWQLKHKMIQKRSKNIKEGKRLAQLSS
jgi:hypothetical protein